MKSITRYPKIGDKRIVEKFLLFPLTIEKKQKMEQGLR